MRSRRTHRLVVQFSAVLAVVATVFVAATPAGATDFVPLVGDGSSWAQPAIDQWSRDVNSQNITINFSGDGSAAGRQHYIENQADFAASDIAFLTSPDPFGAGTESSSYAYSYVPIVAGGTSFMYNLVVAGQKITNLRLSGETLAKIFTGKITNWDDPAITHDYGAQLPSQQITVVTRSDGSGASYMFTRWLWKEYPSIWKPFCTERGGAAGCGPTEFYPGFTGSVQRNGSDQVASYIASPSIGNGSIGYDEYSYALNNNIPVVKVLNSAGYYSLPTASNVAIALQKAVIDENPKSPTFLMQNLDQVYTNHDPRTYPLSSYSYLIVPRDSRIINGNNAGPPSRFTTQKGSTLSTWMNYVLCGAQQKSGALGYSPLPKNLVVGGFKQIDHVPGHVATPNLKQLNGCNNPTYSDGVNHLIADAPMPSKCDKVGAPLTCDGSTTPVSGTSSSSSGSGGGGNTGKQGGSGNGKQGGQDPGSGATDSSGANVGGVNTTNGGGPGVVNPAGGTSASNSVDPDTGLVVGGGNGGTGETTGPAGTVPLAAVPVSLNGPAHTQNWLMAGLTTLDIVAAIVLPGLMIAWLRRRKRADR